MPGQRHVVPLDDYGLHSTVCRFQEEVRLELAELHKKLDTLLDGAGGTLNAAPKKQELKKPEETELAIPLTPVTPATPLTPLTPLAPATPATPATPVSSATPVGSVTLSARPMVKALSLVSETSALSVLERVLSPAPSKQGRCFQATASTGTELFSVAERSSQSDGDGADSQSQPAHTSNSLKAVRRAAKIERFRRRGLKIFSDIWDTMEDPDSGPAGRLCAKVMPIFIIVTIGSSLMQTLFDPPLLPAIASWTIETVFDTIYLLEFALRFVACPNRAIFFTSPYNAIDLLAATPLPIRLSLGFELPPLTVPSWRRDLILCGVPMVRLLKLLRRFEKFQLLLRAFSLAAEALPVLLFILSTIWVFFAMLIFLVEDRETIPSVATAAWFTIVTMTTVGYGDITPSTGPGSVIAGFLVVVTVLYMAIPLGIVGDAFTQTWNERDRILLMQKTHDRLKQWGYTAHDIPELFRLSDDDDNGQLDMSEFRDLLRCMQIGFTDERIFQLFNSFDHNRNGGVDDREFIRVLFPNNYHDIYRKGSCARASKVVENLTI